MSCPPFYVFRFVKDDPKSVSEDVNVTYKIPYFEIKVQIKYENVYKFKMYEVKLDKNCLMYAIIVNYIMCLFKDMIE